MNKIHTITLSPALDVEYKIPLSGAYPNSAAEGFLSRAYSHTLSAGGKGINVSRALSKLGENPTTIFPAGGDTGELLTSILSRELGGEIVPVKISAPTRVNTTVIPDEGEAFEINAPGAPLGDRLETIEQALLDRVEPGDVACVCGSTPSDVDKSYPAELCAKLRRMGVFTVLDCDGEALKIAAKADKNDAASLVKPNSAELYSLTGARPRTPEEFALVCAALPFGSVILTMGGDGAMLCSGKTTTFIRCEKVKPARIKGAGDTFLAAYLFAKMRGEDDLEAMSFASDTAGEYVKGL